MSKSYYILLQTYCPQHLLSRFFGWMAECRWKFFKNWAIKRLIRKYHVNASEALSENLDDYPNFNSFFTRKLKPELRPIAQGANQIASPVDGSVSQVGKINEDAIFQAKNFSFSATTLLGGNATLAYAFRDGSFATLYLAPRDYHRVHMPVAGKLRETTYIPGKLFSVDQYTTQGVPNLFARNERLVCIFDTELGPMAVILVGAMLVGQIETSWEGSYCSKKISTKTYTDGIYLERGADLGHFKMGSTVIILFAKDKVEWLPTLHEGSGIKMGEAIGNS